MNLYYLHILYAIPLYLQYIKANMTHIWAFNLELLFFEHDKQAIKTKKGIFVYCEAFRRCDSYSWNSNTIQYQYRGKQAKTFLASTCLIFVPLQMPVRELLELMWPYCHLERHLDSSGLPAWSACSIPYALHCLHSGTGRNICQVFTWRQVHKCKVAKYVNSNMWHTGHILRQMSSCNTKGNEGPNTYIGIQLYVCTIWRELRIATAETGRTR